MATTNTNLNNPPLVDTHEEIGKMTGKGIPKPQAEAILNALSSFFAGAWRRLEERLAASGKSTDDRLAAVDKQSVAVDKRLGNIHSTMHWAMGLVVAAGLTVSGYLHQQSEQVRAEVQQVLAKAHKVELAVQAAGNDSRERDVKQDAKLDALEAKLDAKLDAQDAKLDAQDAKLDAQDAKLDALWAEAQAARERDAKLYALLVDVLKQNDGAD